MRSYRRADRVAPLIKEILADLIQHRARDPRLQSAVLTRVEIGDDLRIARVLFRVLEGTSPEAAQAALERARGFLRGELGRQLEMKFTPELRFIYDDSVEHVERVERILADLKKDD